MENKKIGWFFLALGLIFIEPTPDFLTLGIYSLTHGLTFSSLNFSNISSILWDFESWSISIGVVLSLIGMYFLNWDFKKLWAKINLGKYNLAVILAICAVLFVAVFDIWSMGSGVFGSVVDYTNGNYNPLWWGLFFKFVMAFFVVVPICYYFLVRRDKSEAFGIFGASYIMWMSGLADIFYFIFQKACIPERLPWLDGHMTIGPVSDALGYVGATNVSLVVTVVIGFAVAYLVTKILKDKF